MPSARHARHHHRQATCNALASVGAGAVEILGASSDSTVPSFNTAQCKEKAMTTTNTILADRVQLDLIQRLEEVRDTLERMDRDGAPVGSFQTLADNALREVIDYLVAQREVRVR